MWHSIAETKNKYKGQKKIAVVAGTGPTLDHIDDLVAEIQGKTGQKPVLIGINRAIVARNDFEFVFADRNFTLEAIHKQLGRTKWLCMPWFSGEGIIMNFPLAQKYQNKIMLYTWEYENEQTVNNKEYPLNHVILYISWGNAQSCIHFVKHLGIDEVLFIGVDGGPVNGKTHSLRVEQIYGKDKQIGKKNRDYKKIKAGMERIANIASVKIGFYHQSAVMV